LYLAGEDNKMIPHMLALPLPHDWLHFPGGYRVESDQQSFVNLDMKSQQLHLGAKEPDNRCC